MFNNSNNTLAELSAKIFLNALFKFGSFFNFSRDGFSDSVNPPLGG
jgi:hypothetical protein